MRRNPLIVLLALSALLLSTTGSALADSHDEYIAEAAGIGYSVSILGEEAFFGGVSGAEITSDPWAEAFGIGSSFDEESHSQATAENDGDHETDEGEGSLSQIPVIGDMVQVRSSSEAGITDGLPFAEADADGLLLELSGEALAEVLAEVFLNLEPVTTGLDEGIDELESQVLDPVTSALADACLQILGGIQEPVDDGLNALRDGLQDVVNELPDEFDDLVTLLEAAEDAELIDPDGACGLLLTLLTDPPRVGDVLEALIEALEGLTLLSVELASSESFADAVPDEVVAFAEAVGLDVTLPSLAMLGDTLETVLGALVDDFVDEVIDTYIEPIAEISEDILPDELMQFLSPILTLEILDDDTPILQITAGDTEAFASFDRETAAITTEGTAVPLRVSIAESIAGLLGQEATLIEVDEGEEVWIFEDTPLASRLAGGVVTTESAERDGLEGEEVTAEAFALQLINFEEDGETFVLDVTSAESYAAVFGQVDVAEEPPVLPVTGGSAVPIALLLLAAGLLFTRRVTAPVVGRDES